MTQDGLQRALIDLGWITLIHRALQGKPSSSFALHQLMRSAGKPVTYNMLVKGYAAFHVGGGAVTGKGTDGRGPLEHGSRDGIRKRVQLLRSALADLGVEDVIDTVPGGYMIREADRARVEAALLEACGFALEAA